MERKEEALCSAFATLKALSELSLLPTAKQMALRAAGECLWGLGVDDYEGIKAVKPVKHSIDIESSVINRLKDKR